MKTCIYTHDIFKQPNYYPACDFQYGDEHYVPDFTFCPGCGGKIKIVEARRDPRMFYQHRVYGPLNRFDQLMQDQVDVWKAFLLSRDNNPWIAILTPSKFPEGMGDLK